MVQAYLQKLRALLDGIVLPAGTHIECKHFFSGAAAYADDHIFMTLTPVGLALKLPERSRAILEDLGGSPLRHFSNGPVKKDYVIVPGSVVTGENGLAAWVEQSIAFAAEIPRPGGK